MKSDNKMGILVYKRLVNGAEDQVVSFYKRMKEEG